MKINKFILSLIILFAISQVCALNTDENQTIANMGHAIRIESIKTTPENLVPGNLAILDITIKNNAKLPLDDLRAKLELPSGFSFLNDANQVKISRLESGESKNISYNIIASQTTSEGIYDASLILNYVSYLGLNYANVGEDKEDNYTFGLIVKGIPNIIAQIEKSEIYKGNDIGTVTVKFVNNGVGNVKFLTVELLNSENYEIISSNIDYIGDLDSDDFESVDFRIKIKKEETTDLLLKMDYKDSLNEDYSKEFKLPLEIRSAKELGITTNGTSTTIVIVLIIAVAGYFIYRKFRKKKKIITI
ncbi:MAG: hypothetical protein PHH54_05780 [Candidatus Nanoarchaeia archaeon]|nr:hypothetical protein [Candidatus Nanoarchaeia archaeon]MDD5741465.1 hypothetical protein [Candidatus Nanoarchaeia archaeon]